jgi:hypothetical protein
MKKILLIGISICSTIATADSLDFIHPGDNSQSIAKRNYSNKNISIKDYEDDIKQWNPKINDWVNPPAMELIYVEYPYPPFLGKSPVKDPGKLNNQKYNFSIAYSNSRGSYIDKLADLSVKSTQNFDTFGISSWIKDRSLNHSFVNSAYIAKAGKTSVNGQTVNVPLELGLTAYYQYNIKLFKQGIYGGLDYESLNLIDVPNLIKTDSIKIKNKKIIYGTMGYTQSFSIFEIPLNIKLSGSKILNTQVTGYKGIVFLSLVPKESNLSYHIFYKHHDLKNDGSNVKIDRIGLSLSYSFF